MSCGSTSVIQPRTTCPSAAERQLATAQASRMSAAAQRIRPESSSVERTRTLFTAQLLDLGGEGRQNLLPVADYAVARVLEYVGVRIFVDRDEISRPGAARDVLNGAGHRHSDVQIG